MAKSTRTASTRRQQPTIPLTKYVPGPFTFAGDMVAPGTQKDLRLKISELYTGDDTSIPIRIMHAAEPGPVVFISAAVHGDEINGTGIIHDLLFGDQLKLERGTLILAPVINVFGFETHERNLPDRRDLNRSFPGSATGSLAARFAHTLMTEVIQRADFGIDLHSAAFQRTNFPNVRADLTVPACRRLSEAFGCSLVVDGKGPAGSLRREATASGVPTIILEAGEPWKMEPSMLEVGVNGIRNVLIEVGMLTGRRIEPVFVARARKTTWIRADAGGILRFHVSPGDLVEAGQALATTYSILGNEQNTLYAERDGIVLGMATLPAVKPGEPVCHIAYPTQKVARLRQKLATAGRSGKLHKQVYSDLATSFTVTEAEETGNG